MTYEELDQERTSMDPGIPALRNLRLRRSVSMVAKCTTLVHIAMALHLSALGKDGAGMP
jgi:hypothetical protein